MLICDGCLLGYHLYCVQPPLQDVPQEDIWLCHDCLRRGHTAAGVAALRQQAMPVATSDAAVFPSVQQRAHDAAAQELAGKDVWLKVTGTGGERVHAVLEYVQRIDRVEHPRSPLRAVAAGLPPAYMSLKQAQQLVAAGPPEGAVLCAELAYVFAAEASPAAPVITVSPGMARDQVVAALQHWSGQAPSEHLLCTHEAAAEQLQGQEKGVDLGVTGAQMAGLMRMVDLRWCAKLAVVGGPAAGLTAAYRDRYGKGGLSDKLCSEAADLLSSVWYRQAHRKVPLDWVFMHPGQGVIEMALGLAVQQARKGVAALVQRSVLTDMSSVLAAMLQRWEQEQRLVCVSQSSSTLVWLVVFASAEWKQRMVSVWGKSLRTDWEFGSWR
jgi:hypothetical protein